ncbi:MAG TPA: FIST N-terminal domain-containing protein [Polyangiaceae bacterium]
MDGPSTVVFVFGAADVAANLELRAALRELRSFFGQSVIVGCSTAGEIHGTRIHDDGFSVAVMRLERSRAAFASAAVAPGRSFEAGERIASELARNDLRSVHIFSDGLGINGSELVRGLNSRLPCEVVATGGLAADGSRFARTWVLERGIPKEHVVTAVGLYGNALRATHGSRGGWDIFGPERRVTRSEANVLYELDGKPALELYKRYLGDRAAGLPSTALLFPLALRTSKDDRKTLVRTVLSVDEATNSMTFAGDVPTGALAQLMHANFDRLIEGASSAALATATERGAVESLTIAVSCVGRRLVLGERAEEEVEAVFSALSQPTNLVGFYSYGEISPYATGHCDLHNQTMTLTTLWEDAA